MEYTAAIVRVDKKNNILGDCDDTMLGLEKLLTQNNWEIHRSSVVNNTREAITSALLKVIDDEKVRLVIVSGGVGFAKGDITPEVTREIIGRECSGIAEAMRAGSVKITPRGMLSRSVVGIRNKSLIINVPGNARAAYENLEAVIAPLHHAVEMLEY